MTTDIENVKHWMERYKEKTLLIDRMTSRLDALKDKAYSPQSPKIEDIPNTNSGDNDRIGRNVAICDSIEQEILEEVKKADNIRAEIETAINTIKGKGSADKCCVLKLRYLDLFDWNTINDTMWMSKPDYIEREDSYKRRTHKICQEALADIAQYVLTIKEQEKE